MLGIVQLNLILKGWFHRIPSNSPRFSLTSIPGILILSLRSYNSSWRSFFFSNNNVWILGTFLILVLLYHKGFYNVIKLTHVLIHKHVQFRDIIFEIVQFIAQLIFPQNKVVEILRLVHIESRVFLQEAYNTYAGPIVGDFKRSTVLGDVVFGLELFQVLWKFWRVSGKKWERDNRWTDVVIVTIYQPTTVNK